MSKSTARRWRADGKLHLRHRGVYSLGHASVPVEGRMVAALLYTGSGSVLSHATAAWWWGLVPQEPAVVHVSCRRRVEPSAGLVVHQRRAFASTRHRRFPVTTVPQTLLDLAAGSPLSAVRRALAEADYRRLLNLDAMSEVIGRGRPGSVRLRQALESHQPRLAHTRSELERAFLALCEAHDLRLPEVNAPIEGWTVDALWRQERVVVEVDGIGNHGTPAQMIRDRRKDLALRAAGFIVLRYSSHQVFEEPALVVADLSARLRERQIASA